MVIPGLDRGERAQPIRRLDRQRWTISPPTIVSATIGTPGRYTKSIGDGGVEHDQVAAAPGRSLPMSSRRSADAPPAVAARIASSGVMPSSRTARAMQNGIDVV